MGLIFQHFAHARILLREGRMLAEIMQENQRETAANKQHGGNIREMERRAVLVDERWRARRFFRRRENVSPQFFKGV